MNISQRLRTCAKHTALDAVIELLNEAADEIDRLKGAQPAEVTDAMIDAIAAQHTRSVDSPTRYVTDARAVVRAILALCPATTPNLACESVQARLAAQWGYVRPVQVPMTPTERERELDRSPVDASWEAGDAFMEGIYAAEAHHGIAAQAKEGGA